MVPVRVRGALCHPGASVPVQGVAVRVAGGEVLEAPARRALPRGHEGARVVLRYHPYRAGVEPFHQGHGLDRPAPSAERSSGLWQISIFSKFRYIYCSETKIYTKYVC